jgi:hypothetical protein
MNAPSVDIKSLLEEEDSSAGTLIEDDIFVGKEPKLPNNCITIFDTPGYPPMMTLNDKGYEYPSVQIRVRNTDYRTGWAVANDIKDLLHGRNQKVVGGTLYTMIKCVNGPFFLDWDEQANARFVCNFDIQRR